MTSLTGFDAVARMQTLHQQGGGETGHHNDPLRPGEVEEAPGDTDIEREIGRSGRPEGEAIEQEPVTEEDENQSFEGSTR
jgi:hypothetical protein